MTSTKDYEVKKKAGEYAVKIKIDKNPPVVGDNNITVTVKDASGKPVIDVKVKVRYSMPAMPGMPAKIMLSSSIRGNYSMLKTAEKLRLFCLFRMVLSVRPYTNNERYYNKSCKHYIYTFHVLSILFWWHSNKAYKPYDYSRYKKDYPCCNSYFVSNDSTNKTYCQYIFRNIN